MTTRDENLAKGRLPCPPGCTCGKHTALHPLRREKSPHWKGDDVGYEGLHKRIRKLKTRKGICEHCGARGWTDFANVSGEYKDDPDDYIELCRKCHKKFDA